MGVSNYIVCNDFLCVNVFQHMPLELRWSPTVLLSCFYLPLMGLQSQAWAMKMEVGGFN